MRSQKNVMLNLQTRNWVVSVSVVAGKTFLILAKNGPRSKRNQQLTQQQQKHNNHHHHHHHKMVILAAAAITLAGVGAYKGGQAASGDIQKKARRFKTQRARQVERQAEQAERHEQRESATVGLSVAERLDRFKQSVPGGGGADSKQPKKRFGGLFKKTEGA
jgi:Tfp pilus assembly protein PilN